MILWDFPGTHQITAWLPVSPPLLAQNEPSQHTDSRAEFGVFALTAAFGPLDLLHILLHNLLHKRGEFPP